MTRREHGRENGRGIRVALAAAAAAGLLAPGAYPALANDGTGLSFNGSTLTTSSGAAVPTVQDFSSLPTDAFNSQAAGTNAGPAKAWADDTTVPGWFAYETALGAPTTYNANTSGFKEFVGDGTPKPGAAGSQTLTGGLFTLLNGSNGVATQTTHLALGAAGTSSSGDVSFGVKIFNDTQNTYKTFSFSYKGEEWFDGSQNATPLQFAYAINPGGGAPVAATFKGNGTTAATSGYVVPAGNAGTFFPINNLDDKQVDGTLAANSQIINPTISLNTPWAPGQALWLTWTMAGAGKGPALGITDFTGFTASANTGPAGHNLNWNPGSTTWNAASTANTNWYDTNAKAATYYTEGDTANFTDTGVGAVTVDANGVNPGAVNVSNSTGTYTFSGGPIGGTGALTKTGAGTLVLASPNTFQGGLAVNGGKVQFSNDNQLGATAAPVGIDNGATLQPTAAFSSSRAITIGTGGGTLDTQAFNASTSGKFTANGSFVKTGAGTLTFTGGVAAVSTSSFTVAAGSGAVIFQGVSGSAQTIVAPAGAGGINGNLVVNAPVKFTIAGGLVDGTGQIQVPANNAAVIGATPSDLAKGGTTLTINVPIALNTTGLPNTALSPFVTTVGMSSAGNTLQLNPNAVISGNANLVLSNDPVSGGGAGTVVLGAVNTYTGTTTLNMSGIAQLGVDNALPAAGGLTFGDGVHTANIGTLDLGGHNLTLASLATNLPNGSASTQQLANGITNTGSAPATLSINGSATTTFSGQIGTPTTVIIPGATNNIALHLLAANTGSLTLTGANTFTGGITIDGGTLVIGAPNVFGAGSPLPAGSSVANNAGFVVNADAVAGAVTGTGATTVGAGATLTANQVAQGALTVNGTVVLSPGQSLPSQVGSLTVNAGGKLDVNANSLRVNYGAAASPAAAVRTLLSSGYNNGAWNGTGIATSKGNGTTQALGYVDGADNVSGAPVTSAGSLLIRYTNYGDANCDGTVDSTDYNLLKSNFGNPVNKWSQGDFTYDNAVDISDFNLLKSNYSIPASSFVASHPAASSIARSAVRSSSVSAASVAGPATLTASAKAQSPAPGVTAGASPTDQSNVTAGTVELDVDPSTGDAKLNGNSVDLGSYQITSATSSLTATRSNSLTKQGFAGWDLLKSVNSNLAEGNLTSYSAVSGPIDIGNIFNSAGTRDLVFRYGLTDPNTGTTTTVTGPVVYATPEPASLGLLALGTLGLLARRRRKPTLIPSSSGVDDSLME